MDKIEIMASAYVKEAAREGYDVDNEACEGRMFVAFKALSDAGYAVVPKVPSEAMVKAGNDVPPYIVGEGYIVHADDIYTAMIAAGEGNE